MAIFSTSRSKASWPIKAIFFKIHSIGEDVEYARFRNDRSLLAIWMKFSTSGVFSGVLLGTSTANARRTTHTYKTSIDAVCAKDKAGGFVDISRSMRGLIPPIFAVGIRIAGLNVLSFCRVSRHKRERITTCEAIYSSRYNIHCAIGKVRGLGSFQGQNLQKYGCIIKNMSKLNLNAQPKMLQNVWTVYSRNEKL